MSTCNQLWNEVASSPNSDRCTNYSIIPRSRISEFSVIFNDTDETIAYADNTKTK